MAQQSLYLLKHNLNGLQIISRINKNLINKNKLLIGKRYVGNSATTTSVSERIESSSTSRPTPPPVREPLDLSFSNTRDAYKSKTTNQLLRALLVLKLSSYDFLVHNHSKVLSLNLWFVFLKLI